MSTPEHCLCYTAIFGVNELGIILLERMKYVSHPQTATVIVDFEKHNQIAQE